MGCSEWAILAFRQGPDTPHTPDAATEVARFGSLHARQGIPASLSAAPDFVSKRSKTCKHTAIETRPDWNSQWLALTSSHVRPTFITSICSNTPYHSPQPA
ncbi:hypothetical protein V3481_019487 [Fusarium oxysporum f. sp. vasinfectum]